MKGLGTNLKENQNLSFHLADLEQKASDLALKYDKTIDRLEDYVSGPNKQYGQE